MKHVLILGGGFAGVEAAIALQKSRKFRVTLVSDRDFLYLYPVSIWIPVRLASFEQVRIPLSDIQKRYPFAWIKDEVTAIDPMHRQVSCSGHLLDYDYLIIAFGADKMKPAGVEHTLSVCGKPEMSLEIRERLHQLVKHGQGSISIGFAGNPADKSAMRGGPAFEMAFNIHHYLKKKRVRNAFELTFFAPMGEPGARMGKNAFPMMRMLFDKLNIHTRLGKKIIGFDSEGILFDDGSMHKSDLTLFIPASKGYALLNGSGLPLNTAGFIKIGDDCQVPGFETVYAIGDAAALEGPEWVAKQGHIAEVMGRNVAANIIGAEDETGKVKSYKPALSIICVMDMGNGAAFVYRSGKRSFIIPLPIIGHWMKKGWGVYTRLVKTGKIPRLPGI
jgi:sulfide:quinone oxidoreductase